jgi:hypothetical protein
MSVLTGLFNFLALLYIGRAVLLAIRVARNWTTLRQEPLTRAKQRLAEQAAFFLGVPPAVLVHELAHALAVLVFGGQVVEFGYRVFWGYVVPEGAFTAIENWIIAIAGTLGSLAFGAAVWLILRRNPSRTLQYFGLRAFRFQIYFSLLYYPIFSLFLPIGDWRIIYDFETTPVLSAVTAVVHAASLFLFWRADRAGAFEMVAFDSVAAQTRYEATRAAAGAGDPRARLQVISELWGGGAKHEARRALAAFLADHPDSAEGHLQLALQTGDGRGQIGRDALDAIEKALALGLREPDQVAMARQIAAHYYLERGDGRSAEAQLDAALAATASYDPERIAPARRAELHHLRGQAYRRQGRYEAAYAENELARQWASSLGIESLVQKYTDEQHLIEKHAGRSLSGPGGNGAALNPHSLEKSSRL